MKLRVLVGCEFSGVVREAFRKRGHDAVSCDLLPTEIPGQHIQGDVLEFLDSPSGRGIDLLIAHPPCTYLTIAANGWAKQPGRAEKRAAAIRFFVALHDADVPRVCVENPIGILSTEFRKPDQIIQPHWFGHDTRKATCLWLRGLPPLMATALTIPESVKGVSPKGKKYYSLNWLPRNDERWKIRSRTFQGVADAFAEQWG